MPNDHDSNDDDDDVCAAHCVPLSLEIIVIAYRVAENGVVGLGFSLRKREGGKREMLIFIAVAAKGPFSPLSPFYSWTKARE